MTGFAGIEALRAACGALPAGDDVAEAAVRERQGQLTKPPGSLGRLEDLVAWLARWQRRAIPALDRVEVLVFAGRPFDFRPFNRAHEMHEVLFPRQTLDTICVDDRCR